MNPLAIILQVSLIILTLGGIGLAIYCLIVVIINNRDYHKITYMQNAILLQEKKEKLNETSETNKSDKSDKSDKTDKADKSDKAEGR